MGHLEELGCVTADTASMSLSAFELAGTLCKAVDQPERREAAAALLGRQAAGARARASVRAGLLRGFDAAGESMPDLVAEAVAWLAAKPTAVRARWPAGVGAALAIQGALTTRARRTRAAELAELAAAAVERGPQRAGGQPVATGGAAPAGARAARRAAGQPAREAVGGVGQTEGETPAPRRAGGQLVAAEGDSERGSSSSGSEGESDEDEEGKEEAWEARGPGAGDGEADALDTQRYNLRQTSTGPTLRERVCSWGCGE